MNILTQAKPQTPAIILINPKYPHNVGAVIRAASCFGARQVWFTGDRMMDCITSIPRLPREERMKGYQDVQLVHNKRPFDFFPNATSVAVEVRENSENLAYFEHPKDAVYVFGPEDGSIGKVFMHLCHKFIFIPTAHCLNLAAAVNTILYDRRAKEMMRGSDTRYSLEDFLQESRGFISNS